MDLSSQEPFRIARVIARLNVGGPTRHVVWLTSALNEPPFESLLVTGVVPPGEEDMTAFAAEHGVTPRVIPEMSREISPRDFITVLKLLAIFWRFQPDLIHTHTAKAGAVGRFAGFIYRWCSALSKRRRRVALVHTYHGHVFHSYYGRLKTRIFLGIERSLARVTDAIVVLSEQQRQEIHERFRIGRPERFRIVPLGIDLAAAERSTQKGSALRRRVGIGDDEVVVGIVGRLTEVKNHDLFLRVAQRMRRSGTPTRFVIFGDGLRRPVIEERIRKLDLAERVVMAGTEELPTIYGAVNVIALTSLNEGTPLALIEAMSNGIPVISTAVGGVADLLGTVEQTAAEGYDIRERGITVRSGDETAFASGLDRLVNDPAIASRFARAGREHVLHCYSKDRLIADIVRLYDELRRR